ncbi:MAG: hypothetical protein O6826_05440 [Acidobacteria bacterium]|nr:hypothetical protein [Acidobacteriota bacterium]MCZ6769146.1 hypothetical protein [Acidobacteriota bacterium]MCZ6877834.1 hypothetical protein [Acidobacteriota bacterium]
MQAQFYAEYSLSVHQKVGGKILVSKEFLDTRTYAKQKRLLITLFG